MASPASLLGVLFHHGSERLDPGRQTEPIQADRNRNISKRTSMRGAPGLSGDRFSGTHSRKLARFAQASGAWLRSVRDTSPCPNSETLPTAVEVTSMAPSATPTRTVVRIYTRCRIYSRGRIDRVIFNHHSRRRHNDGAANHEGLGNAGRQLLDNNRRRSPVLVRPRIAFAVAGYRQIGGQCRG